MKKYAWNFDSDAELWYNDNFDTIEECISAAKESIKSGNEDLRDIVYVGETNSFIPHVDAEWVLDQLVEDAAEFAGEVSDGWDAYDYKKKSELEELSEALSKCVLEWLKKYGREPEFYAVENIHSYALNDMEGKNA